MAWTSTDITAIENAIASGELTVQYQDRRIVYRSLSELLRARDVIQAAINTASATTTKNIAKSVRFRTTKGFNA